MTMIPEVHGALRSAVARGAVRRRRVRPRAGLTLSLAAVFVVSGTAIAATGAWRPVLGTSRDGHPKPAARPLSPQLRNGLGVLARPQTDADRSAAVQTVLKYGFYTRANAPHLADVRLLATHKGGAAVLVPLSRVDYQHPTFPKHDRLCVFYSRTVNVGQPPLVTQTCGDLAGLRAGRITSWMPANSETSTTTIISGFDKAHQWGLVPDGVAHVKVTFYGHAVAWATVHDNFYDATAAATRTPKSTQWFAADGAEIAQRATR